MATYMHNCNATTYTITNDIDYCQLKGHTFWCFHCTDLVLIDLDLTFDYFNKMYDYLNKTHRKQKLRSLQGKMVVEILCLGKS